MYQIPDSDYLICSNSPPTLKVGTTKFEVYENESYRKPIFSIDSQEGGNLSGLESCTNVIFERNFGYFASSEDEIRSAFLEDKASELPPL